ncbi:glycoside hydrolase family 15 protein [Rhodococcus rhodochrous]|uniref:glycoside hydrolase family 15 protein n=1 Tax=Rhodococcus rhodochrous TaxID=1829 RepID=UPI003FD2713D
MIPARDDDGYADLRSYAALGDGDTVALVAEDGSVDWYPVPHLDSHPVFARLLDAPAGGSVELRPVDEFTVERAYVPGTNVLSTVFTTAQGRVRVTDSIDTGVAGRLPWGELARRVEGLDGEVAMRWTVAPGTGLGRYQPWCDRTQHGPVLRVGTVSIGVRTSGTGEPVVEHRSIGGGFVTWAGSRHLIAVLSTENEPLPLPDADAIDANIDRTVDRWKQWSSLLHYDGPWADAVIRSALALKLLQNRSGAIAAAATTSVPESPDGEKNWDYRFAWVRDAAYTLHALIRLGDREEVHAAMSWLLRVVRDQGSDADAEVFTRLDGGTPDDERRLDVPGWRGIGPVVEGNRAAGQLQLGIYGDLFEIVTLYSSEGYVLDIATARLLARIADHTCDVWQQADHGIWELLDREHYTNSKMSCWHALDRAVHLAEVGQIPGTADRWRRERDLIRDWIEENCWSDELGCYTAYPGTDRLDASVLLGAVGGYDRGSRMQATCDALRRELGRGPLLYRFSGADKEEGTFVACAFWMVAALAETGRTDEATELMGELVPLANDVGLYSEMIAEDGTFLGNLPQGLSHLALMTAALTLIEKY